jgi:hypothetical protein
VQHAVPRLCSLLGVHDIFGVTSVEGALVLFVANNVQGGTEGVSN